MKQGKIPEGGEVPDVKLREAVMFQLDCNPEVISTSIGVIVTSGIVTLTGYVDNEAEKLAAEHAAKSVFGVRALVSEIQLREFSTLTDQQIARNVVHAIESHVLRPADRIMVTVCEGHVLLEGHVRWLFEREAAESAVRDLLGVTGISNEIEVVVGPEPADHRKQGEPGSRGERSAAERQTGGDKTRTATGTGRTKSQDRQTSAV